MRRDGVLDDHAVQVREVAPEARGIEELRDALLPDREAFPREVADTRPMPQVCETPHPAQQIGEVR